MSPDRMVSPPGPPDFPYVLLVEDNTEDEALAQRILKKYRIANHVVRFRDGEETVRTLREWLGAPGPGLSHAPRQDAYPIMARKLGIKLATPQLVLLSFTQPRSPALEIVRQIRALPGMGTVPIALCCSTHEEERAARESGMARTCPLSKPIGFFKLLECIQKMEMHWVVFAEKP